MDIFEFEFENWYTFCMRVNWGALVIAIVIIAVVVYAIRKTSKYLGYHTVDVDEVSLGIGDNSIKLKYNKKDQEIAYKLWVELNTRKIGLEFDQEYDVIDEVYNSWYTFFTIARELLKEIPATRLPYSTELITLTTKVLNDGLRPHLTTWQAKYRKWYGLQKEDIRAPQVIQKDFPEYDALVADLLLTNNRMIEYKKLMCQIAFNTK
ncbi:MAG: hypothetical protein U0M06_11905 [Clostridia bacterium]|nr:hypothetical protein [Clostridia bacterium]